ncbi:MAG: ATP-binding protein, partial [Thiogranum sp.]
MPDSPQTETPLPVKTGAVTVPFVGRDSELQALYGALERAETGTDQLVMLAGEAGMGKTRLCQELAAETARRNIPTVWGQCFEEPGAPPYWPWILAFRALIGGLDDRHLRSLLGDAAAPIAGIVPELHHRLGDLPPLEGREADQLRFQLFHAASQVWQRVAVENSLLLILENLHWADPTSLRLLSFFAAELGEHRLMVLGTYRQTE